LVGRHCQEQEVPRSSLSRLVDYPSKAFLTAIPTNQMMWQVVGALMDALNLLEQSA
jgi:hypothetical protein